MRVEKVEVRQHIRKSVGVKEWSRSRKNGLLHKKSINSIQSQIIQTFNSLIHCSIFDLVDVDENCSLSSSRMKIRDISIGFCFYSYNCYS